MNNILWLTFRIFFCM